MSRHRLDLNTPLHGYFSKNLAPALIIESGDTVEFKIPDAAWNSRCRLFAEDRPEKVERSSPNDTGHCLSGPIAMKGAMPGDTLEIKIEEIQVAEHGWTSSGGWPHEVHQRLGLVEGPESDLFWQLDAKKGIGENQLGHQVRLHPFLGVMGMPQHIDGIQPTPPPRRTGGNLDCKELVAGSTLYLPIEVEGGLFSTGDGHAAQGDGEVCVTAIECPIEKATLTFSLRKDMPIGSPRIRTAGAWMFLGVHEDLDEAVFCAIEECLSFMQAKFGVDKKTALGLASVIVDLRVTQIVNGVKGAHAILRDDAILGFDHLANRS